MESFHIYEKDFEKTAPSNLLFRVSLIFFLYLYFVPKVGLFDRDVMELSGFTEAEYPLLFTVLYERNN